MRAPALGRGAEKGDKMTIRWVIAIALAVGVLAPAGVARAELVDPATGDTAAGTTDSLAVDDEIVDSPAAFDDADNALIAMRRPRSRARRCRRQRA